MKPIRIAILAAGIACSVLVGCVSMPTSVEQIKDNLRVEGRRYEFNMSQAPAAAAGCVGRNIENMNSLFFGPNYVSIVAGRNTGSIELSSFFTTDYGPNYSLVADFIPNNSGTKVTAWLNTHRLEFVNNKMLTAFIGC